MVENRDDKFLKTWGYRLLLAGLVLGVTGTVDLELNTNPLREQLSQKAHLACSRSTTTDIIDEATLLGNKFLRAIRTEGLYSPGFSGLDLDKIASEASNPRLKWAQKIIVDDRACQYIQNGIRNSSEYILRSTADTLAQAFGTGGILTGLGTLFALQLARRSRKRQIT